MTRYAYYSAAQEAMRAEEGLPPHIFWKRRDGATVGATVLAKVAVLAAPTVDDGDDDGTGCLFHDRVFLGEVVEPVDPIAMTTTTHAIEPGSGTDAAESSTSEITPAVAPMEDVS